MRISEDLREGIDGFIEQTLMQGCDDYVMAAHLVGTTFSLEPVFRDSVAPELLQEIAEAARAGGQIEFIAARAMSLAIIRKVLTGGLMEIGDLYHGFRPWPVSIETALQRVRSEWEELAGHLPDPGLYWLRITERGRLIGQPALQRWQQERVLGR